MGGIDSTILVTANPTNVCRTPPFFSISFLKYSLVCSDMFEDVVLLSRPDL